MKSDTAKLVKTLEMRGRTHPGFADEENFLMSIGQGEGSQPLFVAQCKPTIMTVAICAGSAPRFSFEAICPAAVLGSCVAAAVSADRDYPPALQALLGSRAAAMALPQARRRKMLEPVEIGSSSRHGLPNSWRKLVACRRATR